MKSLLALAVVVLGTCSTVRAQVKSSLTPAEWSAQWYELGQEDETRALAVVLQWTKSPKEVLGYLKKELKPIKVNAAELQKWLKELESDNFRTRKAALSELEYLGKYIKNDLEKALKTANLEAETKQSVEKLLKQIAKREEEAKGPMAPAFGMGGGVSVTNRNGQIEIFINGQKVDLTPKLFIPEGPPRSWVRVSRAVGFLEFSRSSEALELLEKLASGEPDALPTVKAKEALARAKMTP